MNVKEWFDKHRYKASSFSNIKRLLEFKKAKKQTISLVIPTLNEEKTIGKIIRVMRTALVERWPLLDEIVVIDSGSTDDTLKIAKDEGAIVYSDENILRRLKRYPGKGENLWKALHVTTGTIIAWVDADIKNIHPRFVYGLVGPLLSNDKLLYAKPFYKRPIKVGDRMAPLGGGRVTELLIRPLFNQYFPRLAGFIQPLSGEGAARREMLERIPFYTGYGVETAMLIDTVKKFGLRSICQVDLFKRVHRNQSLSSLSKMAFAILGVFAKRANRLGKLIQVKELRTNYKQITLDKDGQYMLKPVPVADKQRPPIITLPEYRKKHQKDPRWLSV
ncbi:MAG: glucosyl-3-phosphoglycerate synthase [archaeon]